MAHTHAHDTLDYGTTRPCTMGTAACSTGPQQLDSLIALIYKDGTAD